MSDLFRKYGFAIIVVMTAAVVRGLLDPWVGDNVPYASFFLAIVVAGWFGGWRPALLATVLSFATADFLFVPPRFSLTPSGPHLVGLITFGLTSLAIVVFSQAMHAAKFEAAMNREPLRITLASIGDGVISTDADGKITFLNPVAENLTGWTTKQAAGLPLSDVFKIINEQTRQPSESPVDKVLKTGKIVGLANHTLLIDRSGNEWPIDDSASPIRDENGSILGVVLVFRNIAEKKQAEAMVRESESRKTAMFNSALDAIISMDASGKVIEINKSAEQTFGYRSDEALGQELATLIVPPEYREGHRAGVRRMFEGGESTLLDRRIEVEAMRADGSRIPVELTINRIGQGTTATYTAYLRDLTDQRQSERLAAEARAYAENIVDAVRDALLILDHDLRVKYVSRSFYTTFDLSPEDVIGKSVYDLADGQWNIPALKEVLEDIVAHNMQFDEYEVEHNFPALGTRSMLLNARRIQSKNGRAELILLAIDDITELKDANRQLRDADRRKDEFLAILAHELRNPLAPIRSGLELMRMGYEDAESLGEIQEIMERQVVQMVRLIDDLMDISRIGRGKLELRKQQTALATVLQNAVEAACPLMEEMNHNFNVYIPDQPIYVHADVARLAQVFANLLNNAAKYSDPASHIELTACAEGNQAIIKVTDSGIGIAPEQLPYIFEMFAQVDRSISKAKGGLGIGLTLVKRLLEMHDGTVEAHSDGIGHGSEFIVRLPCNQPAQHLNGLAMASNPTGNMSMRVLVVDDNQDGANTLTMVLKLFGNEVHTVYDGEAALEAAAQSAFDVVLLDIGLPGMNGHQVCRALRAMPGGDQFVIIAQTGWGQDSDRQKTKDAGFDHHLTKPLDPETLSVLLTEVQNRKVLQ